MSSPLTDKNANAAMADTHSAAATAALSSDAAIAKPESATINKTTSAATIDKPSTEATTNKPTSTEAKNDDTSAATETTNDPDTKDVRSMEYHRQILADKLAKQADDQQAQYVSPSDELMSPCTAKLSALRSKRLDKSLKPKSLFQKASARNLGSSLFDSKSVASPMSQETRSD